MCHHYFLLFTRSHLKELLRKGDFFCSSFFVVGFLFGSHVLQIFQSLWGGTEYLIMKYGSMDVSEENLNII